MIKTKASIAKQIEEDKEFKVIKFAGLKKLPKTKAPSSKSNEKELNSEDEEFEAIFGDGGSNRKKPKKDKNEVTFDKARKEVLNFGISGISNTAEKSEHVKQLLLKLGAKPPKKQARNYREILEEKKQKKEDDEKINKRALFGTSDSLQYRFQKKKSRNDRGSLTKSYGKLDKDSIRKIKQNNSMKNKRK